MVKLFFSILLLINLASFLYAEPLPPLETGVPVPEADSSPPLMPEAVKSAADYFPAQPGAKWVYSYLDLSPKDPAKSTRTVECVSRKITSDGSIRVVLETTDSGRQFRDRYVVETTQVNHTARADRIFKGDFVFKLPKSGPTEAWSIQEKNGTLHQSTASYGQTQAGDKIYSDCVIVEEKVIQNGNTLFTVDYYYANGTGLVSMMVFSGEGQLLPDQSFILSSGPFPSAN